MQGRRGQEERVLEQHLMSSSLAARVAMVMPPFGNRPFTIQEESGPAAAVASASRVLQPPEATILSVHLSGL